jgi:hypothetical protein
MDAIGYTAAVIQLLGTANEVYRCLKRINGAPNELAGLAEDINSDIQRLDHLQATSPLNQHLLRDISKAYHELHQLLWVVDPRQQMSSKGVAAQVTQLSKRDKMRLRWTMLLKRGEIERLQQLIRDRRLSMITDMVTDIWNVKPILAVRLYYSTRYAPL